MFSPESPRNHIEDSESESIDKKNLNALSDVMQIELEMRELEKQRAELLAKRQKLMEEHDQWENEQLEAEKAPEPEPEPSPEPESESEPEPEVELVVEPENEAGSGEAAPTVEEVKATIEKAKESRGLRKVLLRVSLVALATLLLAGGAVYAYFKGILPSIQPQSTSITDIQPDITVIGETAETRAEFISDGFVNTKNGDVEKFIYRGGYHAENDPYNTKFQRQNSADFENEDSYGLSLEGDAVTKKTSIWMRRVMLSPEAIVRLRVQMGIEKLGSMEEENARANELRSMSADAYDQIANKTAQAFYKEIEGGTIHSSYGWILENFMNDEKSGSHANSSVHGRLNGDDDRGADMDLLLTFTSKNGRNIVSDAQGFQNTFKDAHAGGYKIDRTAWINTKEGGTWKWKEGEKEETSTPTPTPPQDEPTPTPPAPEDPTPTPIHEDPTPTPTPEDPTPTPTPTPTPEDPTPTPTHDWGKEGDPHGGDLVDPSDPVDPGSEVSQEENDQTNEGNQGYTDDHGANPGDASDQNGTNDSGFAESGTTAEGADTTGDRLPGGEDQSDGQMAGENPNQENNDAGEAVDDTGNQNQAQAQEDNAPGGDNNSDADEEAAVAGGDF